MEKVGSLFSYLVDKEKSLSVFRCITHFFRFIGQHLKRKIELEQVNDVKKTKTDSQDNAPKINTESCLMYVQYIGPKYTIYEDEEFIQKIENGPVDESMLNSYVRDQITMMKNEAFVQKQRRPRGCELDEMARTLTLRFPNLNYGENANRGYVRLKHFTLSWDNQ